MSSHQRENNMGDYLNNPTWASQRLSEPSIESPYVYHYQNRPPANPHAWDQEWQHRAMNASQPPQRRRPSARLHCLRFMLILGTLFFVFVIASGVGYALVGQSMLEDWYLGQEPYDQEVWCNRFDTYLRSDYLCELRNEAARPDNPFVPTLAPDENSIRPEDLLLTPLFTNPEGVAPIASSTPQEIGAFPTSEILPTDIVPPTATLSPTQTPVPTLALPPISYKLPVSRITPEAQWWNNCGPTTLTMSLTYFGYNQNQGPAATFLKPNREDKNVSPWQMVQYVNEIAVGSTNARALYRIGGNLDIVKRLLANGFPVIIEKGYEVNDLGWMGHYLLLVGYDDTQQIFYTFDSYLGTNSGQGRQEDYIFTLTYWRHFNNTFVVIYEPWREALLNQVLGVHADPTAAINMALEQARAEASANPSDKWAWFNLGDAYARLGQYQEAAAAFEQAFNLQMPWRTLWYLFTPFETYYHLGRYNDVLQLATSLDNSSQNYVEEAWYYRGLAYAAQGQYDQAITQLQRVLQFNENFTPAGEAISAINTNTFRPPS